VPTVPPLALLSTRAFRYCEPATTASAFGYCLFPTIGFFVIWDGNDWMWTWEGVADWMPLKAAQFPDFRQFFDSLAPAEIQQYAPPFLGGLQEPGLLQLWTGYVAHAARGWSRLVRGTLAPGGRNRRQVHGVAAGFLVVQTSATRSLSDSRGWRNYDSKSAARWIFYSIHRLYEETKRHFVPFLALSPTGC
jgi:hypothetical protein